MSEINIERIADVLNLVIRNYADYCDETGEPLWVKDYAMAEVMVLAHLLSDQARVGG